MTTYLIEPYDTHLYRVRVKPCWWRPSTWSCYLSSGRHSYASPGPPKTPVWYFRARAEVFSDVDAARRALNVELRRAKRTRDLDDARKADRAKHERSKPVVVVTDEECDT